MATFLENLWAERRRVEQTLRDQASQTTRNNSGSFLYMVSTFGPARITEMTFKDAARCQHENTARLATDSEVVAYLAACEKKRAEKMSGVAALNTATL